MAELTPEERRKIYEEEKFRLEVQAKLQAEAQSQDEKKSGWGLFQEVTPRTIILTIVGLVAVVIIINLFRNRPVVRRQAGGLAYPEANSPASTTTTTTDDDKSQQIAKFIQERVNTGGYDGCVARSLGYQLVEVKLRFPAGTSRLAVEANVSGVADQFAQVGRLASAIYYRGYSGEQRICEYKYDPYSATVKKVR